jgi:hypothetical protein
MLVAALELAGEGHPYNRDDTLARTPGEIIYGGCDRDAYGVHVLVIVARQLEIRTQGGHITR